MENLLNQEEQPKKKSSFKNFVTKGLSVAALTAMLTACPSPTGPGGTTGGGNGEGGNGGGGNGQEEQTDNIVFPALNANMAQADISRYINTAMNDLAAQAGDIEAGYATLENSGIVGDAEALAGAIRARENDIKGGYGGDVNGAVSTANTGIVEVSRLINAAGGRNLFAYLRGAFMTAQRLAQRKHGGISEDFIKSQLAPIYQNIVIHGGTAPQQSSPLSAQIASLRSSLTAAMPPICGKPELSGMLIQQWEDSAQFEGWTEDIVELFGEQALTRGGQRSVSYDAGSNTITMGK